MIYAHEGISPNSIFESGIRILTMPYVIATNGAQVILEILTSILNRRTSEGSN